MKATEDNEHIDHYGVATVAAGESFREDLIGPEFCKEWERIALARAVAIEVIKYRMEQGISRTELGRKLGMHQPAISRFEEGDQTPSIDMLKRLSEKLGID
ncbi:helix-turn-helix domain-containing protein [Acidithrix ferrooxidans]|nr:helix-turn-helix transcriptional regulator [Acidithrix ferrooxidans]